MRAGFVAFIALLCAAGAAQAQSAGAARLVEGCTADTAYGVAFGERSDRMFTPAPDLAPYRANTTLRRTPNSRQLHMAEIVIELPDADAAIAFAGEVEAAAVASGRFPERVVGEDTEITTFASADGAVRLEISTLGRGAYVSCVNSALQQLALDEAFGRVRVERPTPPSLALPDRPTANVCDNAETRSAFVADFEAALQSPMEYASVASAYSNTLQQWYAQELRERSDFSAEDDVALAMRTLNDPAFAAAMSDGMATLAVFVGGLIGFTEAQEAGDEAAACTHALQAFSHIDAMSAATQRQWSRIEALYREEAARRGVSLD